MCMYKMKLKANHNHSSEALQRVLFKMGCIWEGSEKFSKNVQNTEYDYLYVTPDNRLLCGSLDYRFNELTCPEYVLVGEELVPLSEVEQGEQHITEMAKELVEAEGSKDTNPKDLIGSKKLPINLVPSTVEIYAAMSFAEGASKYGAFNWRIAGVRASIYYAAIRRHLTKWFNGEECDPKTKVPHLASVIAGCGIILDAKLCNKLTDDRPPYAPMNALIEESEKVVDHLYTIHSDKNPRHWHIADGDESLREKEQVWL